MIKFHNLHLYTKAWLLSEMVVYNNFEAKKFVLEYIPGLVDIKFVDTKLDRCMLIRCNDVCFISFQGTKNLSAWFSDFKGIEEDGFHKGIYEETLDIIEREIKFFFKPTDKIIVTGHSRGAGMALIANFLLSTIGFKDVESIGFSGPYVATKKLGIKLLKKNKIRHTNILSDSNKKFPSDPTDDVGVFRGKHYGHTENLHGSAFIFDHSYVNITNNLLRWMTVRGLTKDAQVLATVGAKIAQK